MEETITKKRTPGILPWGWQAHDTDPSLMTASSATLKLLDEAFDLLDQRRSFREVANWLSAKSGIPIGAATLHRTYLRRLASKPRLMALARQYELVNQAG